MKLIACMVTYNPCIRDTLLGVLAILPQVDSLIIFDNGSDNIDELKNALPDKEDIYIICHPQNTGMAFALNRLCSRALTQNADAVLLLDQDSLAYPNMVDGLKKYMSPMVGLVTPSLTRKRSVATSYDEAYQRPTELDRAITSGSLLNLNAYQAAGGYDEDLFVDWVDFEFCLRLRENGYKIIGSPEAKLLHDLGAAEYLFSIPSLNKGRIVMRPLYRSNHAIAREYDCGRSWAIMLKKHRHSPLLHQEKFNILIGIIYRLITSSNKHATLAALKTGYKDGSGYCKDHGYSVRPSDYHRVMSAFGKENN